MILEMATLKDLPMLRKMEQSALVQIDRLLQAQESDAEVQMELLMLRIKIEELEQLLN
jgi:hypothetical protein